MSFIGFDDGSEQGRTLNGRPVGRINANLTGGSDLTSLRPLSANLGIAFEGVKKGGPFDISAELARAMLTSPNPDGRDNRDVVRPWVSGKDITGRPRRKWIVDFGTLLEDEAALYEEPFEYIKEHVRPVRAMNRRTRRRVYWWQHSETVPGLRAATVGLHRFLATNNVSKHRLFVWIDGKTLSSNSSVVFARSDDYFMGVLHSTVHETWARRLGGQVRDVKSGFRYTPTTAFETFPFPDPTEEQHAAIAAAAKALDALRRGWLFPNGVAEDKLRKRTLTDLYNDQPTWLQQAHQRLDEAVFNAYRWPSPMLADDLVARLAALNSHRSAGGYAKAA